MDIDLSLFFIDYLKIPFKVNTKITSGKWFIFNCLYFWRIEERDYNLSNHACHLSISKGVKAKLSWHGYTWSYTLLSAHLTVHFLVFLVNRLYVDTLYLFSSYENPWTLFALSFCLVVNYVADIDVRAHYSKIWTYVSV